MKHDRSHDPSCSLRSHRSYVRTPLTRIHFSMAMANNRLPRPAPILRRPRPAAPRPVPPRRHLLRFTLGRSLPRARTITLSAMSAVGPTAVVDWGSPTRSSVPSLPHLRQVADGQGPIAISSDRICSIASSAKIIVRGGVVQRCSSARWRGM